MQAAVLRTFGQPPRFETFEEPVPGSGEVRVHMEAAAVKPLDHAVASGGHYASYRSLPVVAGTDGVGRLDDGRRMFVGRTRAPFGTMAEWTVAPAAACLPIPEGVDPRAAAAALNPGLSAWSALEFRAHLARGESVMVLGATGTAGRLAIRISRILGAHTVVAVAREGPALEGLRSEGADAIVSIGKGGDDLVNALARSMGDSHVSVVLDYLSGPPAEAVIRALARPDLFPPTERPIRYVQIGDSAGPMLSFPAAILRSRFIEIMGLGLGTLPPGETLARTAQMLLGGLLRGELSVPFEPVPLSDVESAWMRKGSPRVVIVP
jgi:NADPH2:quinone reductase